MKTNEQAATKAWGAWHGASEIVPQMSIAFLRGFQDGMAYEKSRQMATSKKREEARRK